MIGRKLKLLCALAALAAFPAHAVLVMTSPACTTADVSPTATACGGSFAGNDKNQQTDVLAYINGNFGAQAAFLGASDELSTFGPFTSNPDTTTGTLSFDTAIDGAFVLSLKAGNQFSLYYFDGVGDAISSIEFSTAGTNLNAQGRPNGLSHASLYGLESIPAVPEPGTYALMLAGLGMVGFMARRRRD